MNEEQSKHPNNENNKQITIARNFKSMYCIANMFDLRGLTKLSMTCRSFYWISGRKSLLAKFYKKKEQDSILINYIELSKSLTKYKNSRSANGNQKYIEDNQEEKEFNQIIVSENPEKG